MNMERIHITTLLLPLAILSANAQIMVCPGDPVVFQLEAEYYGIKTWEHSTDGVTWNIVEVTENEPFNLQPDQAGWYRVRFHDAECDTTYVSEVVRFAMPSIDLGASMVLDIGGQVVDEWGMPIKGALVRAGCGAGVSTTTDHFGAFLLQDVPAFEQLAHVSVEKEGYFPGSRSFVPADNAEETISKVRIALLGRDQAGLVFGSSGGQVTHEGVTITFPAGAFVRNGIPYSGLVRVFLNHITPDTDALHEQMPGMLYGIMENEPRILLSYGMAAVELTDEGGVPVQLAPGSTATIRFPIHHTQQSTAPPTIPLWWFDEDLGYWIHEGEAHRVGNHYVGEVSHFTWWNCDIPGNFIELKGEVYHQNANVWLSDVQVVIISETMGTGITFTNGAGGFSGLVPLGEQLTIQVWMHCNETEIFDVVHEEVFGPFFSNSAISFQVFAPHHVVTGSVLDCDDTPVEQGYVLVHYQPVFLTEGTYRFSTCADSLTFRAVDMVAGAFSDPVTVQIQPDTTWVEDISTCHPLLGTVTDIEGNVYQTVIIGWFQEWFAENLRTGTYANGQPIPNVTNNVAWTDLDAGAWCNHGNDPGLNAVHGRLYNWYAAAHPAICPAGWHVPTDVEWQTMEWALGTPPAQLGSIGYRGGVQNVGGKLKSTENWILPNMGATNLSMFNGKPGGLRISSNGTFDDLGHSGYWWTASDNGVSSAWMRSLSGGSVGVFRFHYDKVTGYSIRCVRD